MKEEITTDSNILIDSSIWLTYFLEGSYQQIIESEKTIFISSLSVFEIKKKMLDKEIPEHEIKEKIGFIKERAIVMDVNNGVSEKAADISHEKNIPAIDSLIYATAMINNLMLITKDNDFRHLSNVQILD